MSLDAYPKEVRADATTLIMLVGPADRAVTWGLTGTGSISPLTERTDSQGRAYAKYTPGDPDTTVTVTADYGA